MEIKFLNSFKEDLRDRLKAKKFKIVESQNSTEYVNLNILFKKPFRAGNQSEQESQGKEVVGNSPQKAAIVYFMSRMVKLERQVQDILWNWTNLCIGFDVSHWFHIIGNQRACIKSPIIILLKWKGCDFVEQCAKQEVRV